MSACVEPILEEDVWLYATCPEDLRRHRMEILASGVGGTTIDMETICEEMSVTDDDVDDDALLERWFDACIMRLEDLFGQGSAIVHRAIELDDVPAFRDATIAGEHPGCHWSHDRSCASTDYHSGPIRRHTVMLTGRVRTEDVSWGTTIQKLFAHPHEREITIFERVEMLAIECEDTGRTIWSVPHAPIATTSDGDSNIGLPS